MVWYIYHCEGTNIVSIDILKKRLRLRQAKLMEKATLNGGHRISQNRKAGKEVILLLVKEVCSAGEVKWINKDWKGRIFRNSMTSSFGQCWYKITHVATASVFVFGQLDLNTNVFLPFLIYSFYQLLTHHQEMQVILF